MNMLGVPKYTVNIHLGIAGMNREFGLMSLIEDDLLNFRINRNHKAFSKLDHVLVTLLETSILSISLC
jgi:hypothetical protein